MSEMNEHVRGLFQFMGGGLATAFVFHAIGWALSLKRAEPFLE